MERSPYTPPDARVADPPRDVHGLKRRRVLVMILLTIITFGLYYPWWWYRRRPGLNRLNSPTKIPLWPVLLMIGVYVIQFGLALASGGAPPATIIGANGALVLLLYRLAIGIVMLIQTFRAKDIIEEHAAPDPEAAPMFGEQVALSGLMTFFFSIFYLQWAINRYVLGPAAEKA